MQTTQRLTLADCITIALQNQPSIHAQQAAVGAAAEVKKQARSYFLPQIGFSTKYTALERPLVESVNSPLSAPPLGDILSDSAAFFAIAKQAGGAAALQALSQPGLPPFSLIKQQALNALPSTLDFEIFGQSLWYSQLSITQPLYAGGKIRLRNQQAGLGIQVAGADLEKSQQQTVFDTARAYYSILLAKELARITEDTTGQFRAIERLTQSLIDKGDEFVTTADLARIRTLRLLAENQKVEFQRGYDLAYAALRQAMGLDLQAPLAIADEQLQFKRAAIELPEIVELAVTRRPELIKAEIGVRNAVLQEKLAKAEFRPTVGMFGSLSTLTGRRSFPNPGNDELWQLGVAGEMPLFTGGRNLAAVRQAHYQLQQARETQQLARDLITLEVQQAYLEYKEMDERIPLAEAGVRDARTTVDAYNKRYAGNQVADKDMPKFFEDLETANLLLALAKARFNQHLYAYNLALAKIRLVTASHEY